MKIRNILVLIAAGLALAAVSLWMGQQAYSWFPPQASAESLLSDRLFSFLVTLGTFIFLGVTGALVYSVIFYRAAENDISDGSPIEGNTTLEVVWTAIPFFLVLWIAIYSYQIYDQMGITGPMEHGHLHAPVVANAATDESVETVEVLAKQWAWVFRYPDKNITSTELHLPVNKRVRMELRSQDVIHGFYIPAFRVKQDIVPKEKPNLEFTPIRLGKYRLRDSQFSGTYFAAMQANVVVQSMEDYNQWLNKAAKQKLSPAYNQAFAEYHKASEATFKSGWQSVRPAKPPMVNYNGT
jgi:cytochrome c oxidase subunit II